MNLHGLVAHVIGAVNPMQMVCIRRSTGSTTNPDGSRTPTYSAPEWTQAQVQMLSQNDLLRVDGINLQGNRRKVYFTGSMAGVVRASRQGGDLMTFADGSVWLLETVLEQWPEWVAVSVIQQAGK
jgi:hypothetical protein